MTEFELVMVDYPFWLKYFSYLIKVLESCLTVSDENENYFF